MFTPRGLGWAVMKSDRLIWFWIGTHAEYGRLA